MKAKVTYPANFLNKSGLYQYLWLDVDVSTGNEDKSFNPFLKYIQILKRNKFISLSYNYSLIINGVEQHE